MIKGSEAITEKKCAEERPIWIGGSKRGGTTLLKKILDAHSKVTFSPPDFIFNLIYHQLYSYGDLSKPDNLTALIDDCLKIPIVKNYWKIELSAQEFASIVPERSFRGVLLAMNRYYMKDHPTENWGCKTPCNVFWFKEIYKMFPGSRFIFLYRDGRDTSIEHVQQEWGVSNIYTASLEWQSYMTAMLEAKKTIPGESYYEIRYEDMVRQPEIEIAALCRFLDLEYEPEMLRWYENSEDGFSRAASFHKLTNSPITDKYVGIYKKLPDFDKSLFAAVIGDTLRKLGYVVEDEPRRIGFWERERYLEEDRYGGLLLMGGPKYKYDIRNRSEERKKKNIWNDDDRCEHLVIK